MVGVGENERNDQRVGNDRRDGAEETVPAKSVRADRADEGRQSSENDIRQRTARHYVADQAAQRQSGNSG